MSAKQTLIEFVQDLTEDEAEALLWVTDLREDDRPEVSDEDLAAIRRGIADSEAGRVVSHDEMRRRYGLDG